MGTTWLEHVAKWRDCKLCPLCHQRDRIVLAKGVLPADVVVVGEAPGASENVIGLPFVGPAGRLLEQIVERAVPSTVPVAYCNLVACFPAEAKARGDNEPTHKEIVACRPRLEEFIHLCNPRLIVCVGGLAAGYVRRETFEGVRFTDIDHPAFILRMPLAQKGMAVQRAIVVVRNAVANTVQ